jgi:AAA family ATP:ADP antiporter
VWVGIFNLMVVTQFWSFANDVYTTEEGKRLFPVVGFGASSGAVVGSWLTGLLIGGVGLPQLFLVAAAILGIAVALTNVIDARERRRTEAHVPDVLTSGTMPAATGQYRALTGEFKTAGDTYRKESGQFRVVRPGAAPAPEHHGTFALVFRSRYLLLIGALVLLLNWVNATGEYILGRTLERIAAETVAAGGGGGASVGEIVGRFYAAYQGGAALLAMLLQLFVVSRLLKYFGVRTALLILPALAFGGYALLAFAPILAVMRWVKTAENATDYSVQKTTANILFLPTTREEKYKGKQVIDALFYRTGDLLSAGLVFVGTTFLAFQPQQFALVNLLLVAAWIVLAVLIGRRYERLAAATAA